MMPHELANLPLRSGLIRDSLHEDASIVAVFAQQHDRTIAFTPPAISVAGCRCLFCLHPFACQYQQLKQEFVLAQLYKRYDSAAPLPVHCESLTDYPRELSLVSPAQL